MGGRKRRDEAGGARESRRRGDRTGREPSAATSHLDDAMRLCASRLSALEDAKRAYLEASVE